jgi:hypothetical protein
MVDVTFAPERTGGFDGRAALIGATTVREWLPPTLLSP